MNRARFVVRRDARRRLPRRRPRARRTGHAGSADEAGARRQEIHAAVQRAGRRRVSSKPVTKREKDMVVTTIQVKNMSNAADRAADDRRDLVRQGRRRSIGGGKGVINGLLQPGEVQTITIETPFNPKMKSNNYNFTHANGTVKPQQVAKLEAPATRRSRREARDRQTQEEEVRRYSSTFSNFDRRRRTAEPRRGDTAT